MADAIEPSAATGRLAVRMTELIGRPVMTVARVNVIWLDTLRGFSVIMIAAALVHQRLFGDSPSTVWIMLASAGIVWGLAWVALRNFGRPLRLGPTGGVAAVSGQMLYVAGASWITGRPTNILRSWPRDSVTVERVDRLGLRRLVTVKFPGAEAPARLEIVGRNKDKAIADLFGPVTASPQTVAF
jgi:hypothetical protein